MTLAIAYAYEGDTPADAWEACRRLLGSVVQVQVCGEDVFDAELVSIMPRTSDTAILVCKPGTRNDPDVKLRLVPLADLERVTVTY